MHFADDIKSLAISEFYAQQSVWNMSEMTSSVLGASSAGAAEGQVGRQEEKKE